MPQLPFKPIEYVNTGFLLSSGNHCLKLVKTSQEKSREGESYFKFTFQIVDDSCDKDKVWVTTFAVNSPNDDRCRIAREQIAAFFNASGFNLNEYCYTEDLEGRMYNVNVKHSMSGEKTYANISSIISEVKESLTEVTEESETKVQTTNGVCPF